MGGRDLASLRHYTYHISRDPNSGIFGGSWHSGPVNLRTVGYDSLGHSHRQIIIGHLAQHIGRGAGTEAEVLLRVTQPITVPWAELAIAEEVTTPLGNVTLRYVGAVDVSDVLSQTEGGVSVRITVPCTPFDGELSLVIAAWAPDGWAMPSVVGSSWTDPIGSGLVAVLDGDAGLVRPSELIRIGQATQVFVARPFTRPIAAVVSIS